MSDFFQAFCHRFVCFHTHTGFERIFFNFFFLPFPPPDLPESVDKAAHLPKVEVFHGR
jgi:hypothetical protein